MHAKSCWPELHAQICKSCDYAHCKLAACDGCSQDKEEPEWRPLFVLPLTSPSSGELTCAKLSFCFQPDGAPQSAFYVGSTEGELVLADWGKEAVRCPSLPRTHAFQDVHDLHNLRLHMQAQTSRTNDADGRVVQPLVNCCMVWLLAALA